jgi:hypothetical protein
MKEKPRPKIVIERLENISKSLFKNYYSLITELVGNRHGIYALYDEGELYYVGKSADLRKRVKQHLKGTHLGKWSHFSLFLIKNAEHVNEIESLLIRIANPKGNSIVPKGRKDTVMLKKLKEMVKQKQKDEFETMFGANGSKKSKRKFTFQFPSTLEGVVKKNTTLYKTYKGKDYKATLYANGTIKYKNKSYTTPTAVAKAITGWSAINGWTFWYVKDSNGDMVKLADLRKE